MPTAAGVDVGTSNVKVVLVDGGELLAHASRPLTTERRGDVAEQDAEALWRAALDALSEVAAAAPAAAAAVATIGVCSQYSSIVAVDVAGRPVAPMVTYFDTRGTGHSWSIMERHGGAFDAWVARHGIPPVGGGLSLAHVLHLQLDRPDVHSAAAAYLEPVDYVNARLTGRIAATQCTQFTAQLCDNRAVGTTAYDDTLVEMSGVDASRLPPLIAIDGVHGQLLPDVAAACGLPPGAEVRAGMNDSHAGAFATGAFASGTLGLMVGTTAVLLDSVDHMGVDLDHEVVSMPAPLRSTLPPRNPASKPTPGDVFCRGTWVTRMSRDLGDGLRP